MLSQIHKRLDELTPWQIRLLISGAALLSLTPAWINFGIIAMDATSLYVPTAKMFAAGDFSSGFNQAHHLFALLIAFVSQLTGFDFELSGRLVAAFNFILASLALYEITIKLSNDRLTALLAVAMLVFNCELVDRSVDCLKESLLIALVLWGNYLILWPRRLWPVRTLGILLLLIGLFQRSTVILFIMGWLTVWIWVNPDKRLVRTGLLLCLAAVATLIISLTHPPAFLSRNDISLVPIIHYIKNINSSQFAFSTRILAEFFATGGYLAVLAGFWGFSRVKNPAWQISMTCVLVLIFITLFMMGWMADRFLLQPLAWFYPASAIGVMAWLQSGRKSLITLAILTLISLPLCWGHMAFRAPEPAKLDQKRAGLWLKAEVGPDQTIYSNRPRLLFYAEAKAADRPANLAAIDLRADDGQAFTNIVNSTGLKPIKSFGTIKIYQQPQPSKSRSFKQ